MAIIKPSNKYKGKRFNHGRHEGKLIEVVLLRHPDYIKWLSEKSADGFGWVHDHVEKCVERFDALPFLNVQCRGQVNGVPCTNPVTRFSMYPNSTSLLYWCDTCDPYQQGASKTLTVSARYYDALFHVWATTSRNRPYYRNIIEGLAAAKGLTGNYTERNVIKFLYGPNAEPTDQV